ncbi:MAG: hypothetical protein KKG00_09565, partial [Bacteroidetes bacterium]|nr:hypothetical protein [Bacteroidota bacterium]
IGQMFKSYHATTLGPIYQTFRNARRTREVWAASYLFSYLAKGIIIRSCLPNFEGHQYGSLTQEQIVAIIQKSDSFVLPNISDPELFKAKAGVGLFPDRILFASELLGTRNYQEIIDAVLLDIAQMMSSDTPAQQQTGYTFLKGVSSY